MNGSGLSVVIPAFNAGIFLRPAVLSVLAAHADDLEVIVIDDGSTDGSLESIEGLGVRVLRRAHGGEAAARNAGVRESRGQFVTFLDADDLLEPGGLRPRLEWLECERDASAVGGLPSTLIDESGQVLAPVLERMARGRSFPFELTLESYRAGAFFPVSCALYLYRRTAFDRIGFYDETLPAAPDADFHYRLLALGSVFVLKVGAFARRLHGGNASLTATREGRPSFRPEIVSAIDEVNRRYGVRAAIVEPWEAEYR